MSREINSEGIFSLVEKVAATNSDKDKYFGRSTSVERALEKSLRKETKDLEKRLNK